ncbi:hypothetical protein [Mycolicibacterium pyrenivorans]|uniref:hypothetical protein n=1 Tax=Mycolicibacterium pyrenivorans TaxID=187102 RepID=UPI0021F33D14|nr:hypothetical protein [Mycolicibacterium pyrenivorans]MCV7150803.1 hypothetical protein [Mycolicibacterium pyrenivorans]
MTLPKFSVKVLEDRKGRAFVSEQPMISRHPRAVARSRQLQRDVGESARGAWRSRNEFAWLSDDGGDLALASLTFSTRSPSKVLNK